MCGSDEVAAVEQAKLVEEARLAEETEAQLAKKAADAVQADSARAAKAAEEAEAKLAKEAADAAQADSARAAKAAEEARLASEEVLRVQRAEEARVAQEALETAPTNDAGTHPLGLTQDQLEAYSAFWGEAETVSSALPAAAAVMFLTTSGLPKPELSAIWKLANSAAPWGELNKDEFFVACKLVSIRQAGGALSLDNLSAPTSLPKFGVAEPEDEDAEA